MARPLLLVTLLCLGIVALSATPGARALSLSLSFNKRSIEKPFDWQYVCNGAILPCDIIKKAMDRAANRIARAVNIKQTIVVSFRITSFSAVCQNSFLQDGRCGQSAAGDARMGWTVARSVTKQTLSDGTTWTIPSALQRQLGSSSATFMLNDMDVEINQDYSKSWWIPELGIYGVQLNSTTFDMEQLIVHELLHGMGLTTSWIPVAALLGQTAVADPGILVPPFALNDPFDLVRGNQTILKGWRGTPDLSLMDRYTIANTTATNAGSLASEIVKFSFPVNSSLSQFYTLFKSSGAPYEAARKAYDLFTSGPAAATFVTGSSSSKKRAATNSATLHTLQSAFPPGLPLSHLSTSYESTPDFILTPNITSAFYGRTLDDTLRAQGQGYGAIGPQLSSMLTQLGYEPSDVTSGLPTTYGGLTPGELAGVIIGSILAAVLVTLGVLYAIRHCKVKSETVELFESKFGDSQFKAGSAQSGGMG